MPRGDDVANLMTTELKTAGLDGADVDTSDRIVVLVVEGTKTQQDPSACENVRRVAEDDYKILSSSGITHFLAPPRELTIRPRHMAPLWTRPAGEAQIRYFTNSLVRWIRIPEKATH